MTEAGTCHVCGAPVPAAENRVRSACLACLAPIRPGEAPTEARVDALVLVMYGDPATYTQAGYQELFGARMMLRCWAPTEALLSAYEAEFRAFEPMTFLARSSQWPGPQFTEDGVTRRRLLGVLGVEAKAGLLAWRLAELAAAVRRENQEEARHHHHVRHESQIGHV